MVRKENIDKEFDIHTSKMSFAESQTSENLKLAGVDDSTLVIKQAQNNLENGEIIEKETENLTGKASNKARKFNCIVLT